MMEIVFEETVLWMPFPNIDFYGADAVCNSEGLFALPGPRGLIKIISLHSASKSPFVEVELTQPGCASIALQCCWNSETPQTLAVLYAEAVRFWCVNDKRHTKQDSSSSSGFRAWARPQSHPVKGHVLQASIQLPYSKPRRIGWGPESRCLTLSTKSEIHIYKLEDNSIRLIAELLDARLGRIDAWTWTNRNSTCPQLLLADRRMIFAYTWTASRSELSPSWQGSLSCSKLDAAPNGKVRHLAMSLNGTVFAIWEREIPLSAVCEGRGSAGPGILNETLAMLQHCQKRPILIAQDEAANASSLDAQMHCRQKPDEWIDLQNNLGSPQDVDPSQSIWHRLLSGLGDSSGPDMVRMQDQSQTGNQMLVLSSGGSVEEQQSCIKLDLEVSGACLTATEVDPVCMATVRLVVGTQHGGQLTCHICTSTPASTPARLQQVARLELPKGYFARAITVWHGCVLCVATKSEEDQGGIDARGPRHVAKITCRLLRYSNVWSVQGVQTSGERREEVNGNPEHEAKVNGGTSCVKSAGRDTPDGGCDDIMPLLQDMRQEILARFDALDRIVGEQGRRIASIENMLGQLNAIKAGKSSG